MKVCLINWGVVWRKWNKQYMDLINNRRKCKDCGRLIGPEPDWKKQKKMIQNIVNEMLERGL